MARINIGRTAIVYRGDWDISIQYENLDQVMENGEVYQATAVSPSIGISPSINTSEWVKVSSIGHDGDSATITVGTTNTVSSTSPAAVRNTGTSLDAVFYFDIPQGEMGARGITGIGLPREITAEDIGKVLTAKEGNGVIDTEFQSVLRTISASAPAYYQANMRWGSGSTAGTREIIYSPSHMWLNVGSKGFVVESKIAIDLRIPETWDTDVVVGAAARAGKDYYIYACDDNDNAALKFKISANSIVPNGFNSENSRKIGGFHCLCGSVGNLTYEYALGDNRPHWLSGYLIGEVPQNFIWSLDHRPVSEPEGMAWCDGINKFVDIYIASYDGVKLTSRFGAVMMDGSSNPRFHQLRFVEWGGNVKKRLLMSSEFRHIAEGSNQRTNVQGGNDKNITGAYVDTSGRRMISNYGLESCCGLIWQWGIDSAEYSASYPVLDNLYNSSMETSKGQQWGNERRVLCGGDWHIGASCGSRSAYWNNAPVALYAYIAGRFASEPLRSNSENS